MKFSSLCLLVLLLLPFATQSQVDKKNDAFPTINKVLNFRCIGPFRGGRSAAVTGVKDKPLLFYMGTTGGGIWKTENGGSTWKNISDGFFGGSIGAIAVSPSHNNVLYAGGGEVTVRGNVSYGYGVFKSIDGGRSWENKGLPNSRHIPRIRIHPTNPDILYSAVLGDLFKSSEERGVYKSTDGGDTWKKILFANEDAGAVDLIMDPVNPEILYASTWRVRRTPYDFSSGGEGSALWKTTNGGETWEDISKNEGFPKGTLGIIGVTVSPVDPERVWAIVENENGGVYRSEDGGETWKMTNNDRSLRQRAWYYSRIYADTEDKDKVYVVNVAYHTSSDGGKTFKARYAPHGDHHDMWIAPDDANRIIMADDGGGQISYDAGGSWSTYQNQPTSQFYRVTTDNHFPYRIYGAQQDNSAIRIDSRSERGFIGEQNWESTAGGESAHLAPDPTDDEIVYGGSYGGFLTRYNHHTKQNRAINVWPDNPIGYGAEGMKYRFQWNFPLFFSPHDDQKLYTASQHLHVSKNGGETWEIISPDLTRNDSAKLVSSGGPITKDNTGVEYYSTIFSAVESTLEKDLLWCGSDDGLIHVSKDAGTNWTDVTPKDMPEWCLINSIEVDPFNKGGLYVAATMYKWGDYAPYIYHTTDYGQSWEKKTTGIKDDHFTRVIRADRYTKGLLYCGTESGLYLSKDDGLNWKPFQLNLPIVPITDIALRENNMVIATQGRSFWVLDDLQLIWEELKIETKETDLRLYIPFPTTGVGGNTGTSLTAGTNHFSGAQIHYYIPEDVEDKEVKLKFMTQNGQLIREFSTKGSEKGKVGKMESEKGMNRFIWNMRHENADRFDGLLMWWGTLNGPRVPPDTYVCRLICDDDSVETKFEVVLDPRSEGTVEDRKAQYDFLLAIRNKIDETHDAIRHMRDIKGQIGRLNKRIKDDESLSDVVDEGNRIDSVLSYIEGELYQTKLKSNQDMLNYPIKLNNKLAHVASLANMGIYRPTGQMIKVADELTAEIDKLLQGWYIILESELPIYNELIRTKKVNVIGLDDSDE